MLFWHMGATLFLFRWIFRDPKVDVRLLLLGATLPDLVDLPLGTLLLADRYASGELYLHTLAAPAIYMVVALVATRRGRRRRGWMAIGVGWLIHLLLDGMWTVPELFWWPGFGVELPGGEAPYWPLAWERAGSDPWRWVLETVGLGYLLVIWVTTGLGEEDRRRRFVATGRLAERAATDE